MDRFEPDPPGAAPGDAPAAPAEAAADSGARRAVNVAVVYYSSTGTIHRMAEEIAETAEKEGATVRLLRVPELAPPEVVGAKPAWAEHLAATGHIPFATPEDVEWADAVVFGSPSRFGTMAAQLKEFVDTLGGLWMRGVLADKAYSGFTSGSSPHGGVEATLLTMYTMVYHFGGVAVPPGYSDPVKYIDGNPYGTSCIVGSSDQGIDDQTRDAARVQARRVVRYARALKAMRLEPAEA